MVAMVDTVMMYGAKVWGCLGKLQIVEQLQMRGFQMFLGVSSRSVGRVFHCFQEKKPGENA